VSKASAIINRVDRRANHSLSPASGKADGPASCVFNEELRSEPVIDSGDPRLAEAQRIINLDSMPLNFAGVCSGYTCPVISKFVLCTALQHQASRRVQLWPLVSRLAHSRAEPEIAQFRAIKIIDALIREFMPLALDSECFAISAEKLRLLEPIQDEESAAKAGWETKLVQIATHTPPGGVPAPRSQELTNMLGWSAQAAGALARALDSGLAAAAPMTGDNIFNQVLLNAHLAGGDMAAILGQKRSLQLEIDLIEQLFEIDQAAADSAR